MTLVSGEGNFEEKEMLVGRGGRDVRFESDKGNMAEIRTDVVGSRAACVG
jgi:hypothetical protein